MLRKPRASPRCGFRPAQQCALAAVPIVCRGGRAKPRTLALEPSRGSCGMRWRVGESAVTEGHPQIQMLSPEASEEAAVPAAAATVPAANRRRVVATGNRVSAERAARSRGRKVAKGSGYGAPGARPWPPTGRSLPASPPPPPRPSAPPDCSWARRAAGGLRARPRRCPACVRASKSWRPPGKQHGSPASKPGCL